MTLDAECFAALRDAPASVRMIAWMRTVEQIDSGTSEAIFAELERILAPWPARSRPAWGGWYADVEIIEASGPHEEERRDIFRCLLENTVPAFRLARHVGMWFDNGVGAEQIAAFARWPSLRTITSVSLETRYRPELATAIAEFARAPTTAHLREYTLGLAGATQLGIEAILDALPMQLERLWIHDIRIGPSFATILADALAKRPNLIGLALYNCELGAGGIATLAERGTFDLLGELTLHGVRLDDAAATILAGRTASGLLRKLDLEEQFFQGYDSMMHGPGLIALTDAGWFDGLESLELSYHEMHGEAFARLLERADLHELRHLNLNCTGFDAIDAARLRGARDRLPMLEHLVLEYTRAGSETERDLSQEFRSPCVRSFVG